tara:strand:+ start:272 stop:1099 length:828 start_codon:yes stop_codon:yes gene_type:complete
MKNLTTLLLTLLVLGGCATVYDNDFSGWDISNEKLLTVNGPLSTAAQRTYGYRLDETQSIVYVKLDGWMLFNKASQHEAILKKICMSQFNRDAKGVTPQPTKFETILGSRYELPNKFVIQCQTQEEAREIYENQLREIALRKARILEVKKSKCREYGFKDDTDGMGLCLIELDKLAKLEEQILAIEKRNNQVYLQNQQLIADQKRQREAQALINLGAAISGAGVPRTNTPKAPITTYPNSFSSTLTVPSNQVCPILSTPITKQEIRGANRICYYQ